MSKPHTILRNAFWGVPCGGTIDILYVYLDKIASWQSQIKDDRVRLQLDLGDAGEFPHFPNYKTIDENILKPFGLTELTSKQVNLLADLTCWVVRESQSTIQSFLGGKL